jgi:hypothetical protein
LRPFGLADTGSIRGKYQNPVGFPKIETGRAAS